MAMPSEANAGWRPSGRLSGLPSIVTKTVLSTCVDGWQLRISSRTTAGSRAQGRLENCANSIVRATLLREMVGMSGCNRRTARIESRSRRRTRALPAAPKTSRVERYDRSQHAAAACQLEYQPRAHRAADGIDAAQALRIEKRRHGIAQRTDWRFACQWRRSAESREVDGNHLSAFGQRRADGGPGACATPRPWISKSGLPEPIRRWFMFIGAAQRRVERTMGNRQTRLRTRRFLTRCP